MARRSSLTDAALIAAVARVADAAHYGYAPGLAAPRAIAAHLAIGGTAAIELAPERIAARLAALAASGAIRSATVVGPDGVSTDTWFAPASDTNATT